MEEGQIPDDKPINDILMGKNPILWCNEQSKAKNQKMEWEQISETGKKFAPTSVIEMCNFHFLYGYHFILSGPPHDKTFTWSLQMGEFTTVGVANSKKSKLSMRRENDFCHTDQS